MLAASRSCPGARRRARPPLSRDQRATISAKHILVPPSPGRCFPQIPGPSTPSPLERGLPLSGCRRARWCGGGYIGAEFARSSTPGREDHAPPTAAATAPSRLRHGAFGERKRGGRKKRGNEGEGHEAFISAATDRPSRGRASGDLRWPTSNGPHMKPTLVLFATGLKPNSTGLALVCGGVISRPRGRRSSFPTSFSATAVDSIHAIGDVTQPGNHSQRCGPHSVLKPADVLWLEPHALSR